MKCFITKKSNSEIKINIERCRVLGNPDIYSFVTNLEIISNQSKQRFSTNFYIHRLGDTTASGNFTLNDGVLVLESSITAKATGGLVGRLDFKGILQD